MKRYDVCAMGNGVVDILVEVSDDELAQLGWERGSWGIINAQEVTAVLGRFSNRDRVMASGGSVANSLIMFSQLGGKCAFFTSLGKDALGEHFKKEFASYGADFSSTVTSKLPTGCCITLITPDAERTMRICLGAANDFSTEHLDKQVMANSDWVFIEGYLFSESDKSDEVIKRTLRLAESYGTKIALTTSAVPLIRNYRDKFKAVVDRAELIFANENEAMEYAQTDSLQDAVDHLAEFVPQVVVTAGAEGAYVCCDGAQMKVPACKCEPVDLTGAGDAFAGAYLFGITHGYTPNEAGVRASRMAKEVIIRKGARYIGEVSDLRALYR